MRDGLLQEFDEQTKLAFSMMEEVCVDCNIVESKDKTVRILVGLNLSYRLYIVLECTEEIDFNGDAYWYDVELTRKEESYLLVIKMTDDSEAEKVLEIPFTSAKSEIILIDYSNFVSGFMSDKYSVLWETIGCSLSTMQDKRQFGEWTLNDEEKRLLPLTEFGPLMAFGPMVSLDSSIEKYKYTQEQYELVSEYIEKSGCTNLQPMVEKIYSAPNKSIRKKACNLVKDEIIKAEYLPLWEAIKSDIEHACRDYKKETELYIEESRMEYIRSAIEKAMHSEGLAGDYPCFYGKWTEGKKVTETCVECYESASEIGITINFLIGKVTNKIDWMTSEISDVRRVFFKGTGKQKVCEMEMNFQPEKHLTRDEDLYINEFCHVVAKRAFGRTLTKEEENNVMYSADNAGETNTGFCMIFGALIIGVVIALIFTLGMALISLLISLIAVIFWDRPTSLFADIFLDGIWLDLFCGTFLIVEAIFLILVIVTGLVSWISAIKNRK